MSRSTPAVLLALLLLARPARSQDDVPPAPRPPSAASAPGLNEAQLAQVEAVVARAMSRALAQQQQSQSPPVPAVAPTASYQSPPVAQAAPMASQQAPMAYQAPVAYQPPAIYQAPVAYQAPAQAYASVLVPAPRHKQVLGRLGERLAAVGQPRLRTLPLAAAPALVAPQSIPAPLATRPMAMPSGQQ